VFLSWRRSCFRVFRGKGEESYFDFFGFWETGGWVVSSAPLPLFPSALNREGGRNS
jgi:hypothetical protein